nr:unnamed protein product [Callosobruchus analis]
MTRPLGARIHQIQNDMQISFPEAHARGVPAIPPWLSRKICVRMDCTKYKKDTTHKSVYLKLVRDIIDSYDNPREIIFTDGSKTEEGVGAAVVTDKEILRFQLRSTCSIYTAELTAILQAMIYVQNNRPGTYLVCSDSLSSILSLQENFSKDPLIQQISSLNYQLCCQSKIIVIVWVPGHIGVRGNEVADQAAKAAISDGIPETKVRYEDLKHFVKVKCQEYWQREWQECDTHLKLLQPTIKNWSYPKGLSRKEQVCLTRVRIGHSRLTSCHLFGLEPQICEECQCILKFDHILVCPRFRAEKSRLNVPDSLQNCFHNHTSVLSLLKFLKIIKFFHKI